jgi:hypothetical protein
MPDCIVKEKEIVVQLSSMVFYKEEEEERVRWCYECSFLDASERQ